MSLLLNKVAEVFFSEDSVSVRPLWLLLPFTDKVSPGGKNLVTGSLVTGKHNSACASDSTRHPHLPALTHISIS